MSKQKISIGLVGVANHGNTILNAIMAAPNLTLVFLLRYEYCRGRTGRAEIGREGCLLV